MKIEEYIAEDWRAILQHNQAGTFEQLWQLHRNGDWFEAPNKRRGGWSGVMRTSFAIPGDGNRGVFIKFQENHVYRSWTNFFRPVATFVREFHSIQRCRKLGIATLEPVYFAQRRVDGQLRAILVTQELEGYRPADAACYKPVSQVPRPMRQHLIFRIADAIRHMHQHHIQHNCLYPKHIFVREGGPACFDIRFIDLEKVKWRLSLRSSTVRDLGTLYRHTRGWSRTDRLRLFLAYRQENRLSKTSKKVLKAIIGSSRT